MPLASLGIWFDNIKCVSENKSLCHKLRALFTPAHFEFFIKLCKVRQRIGFLQHPSMFCVAANLLHAKEGENTRLEDPVAISG